VKIVEIIYKWKCKY